MAVIDQSEIGLPYPTIETTSGFITNTHHLAAAMRLSGVGNGNANFHPSCFLSGTHIAGVNGEVLVEALQIGDAVKTLENGKIIVKPVTWIGHRRMTVPPGARDDEFPVRVRAHAFADNIPHRDLMVTGDHGMFVAGRLIPVRMLVNGGSILFDRNLTSFEFFHLELAAHAILLAEGLTSESYLECGNRGQFANAPIVDIRPDMDPPLRLPAQIAAARCTDCDIVEPIWNNLKRRALARGQLRARKPPVLVSDPNLQLETQTGLRIRPYEIKNACYRFAVPAGTSAIHLISRACSPAEIIGPYIDDRRQLGVLVSAVVLETVDGNARLEPHKQIGALPGWHATEPHAALRWTNGRAALPLNLGSLAHAPGLLQVDIAHAGPYLKATPRTGTPPPASRIQYG